MEKSKYPVKINGYIYSPGTKRGFERMKRLGIPRPLFRIEDKLARILKTEYKKLVRRLLQDLKEAASDAHVTLDRAPMNTLTLDADIDELIAFFDMKAKDEELTRKANLQAAANSLEHQWLNNQEELNLFDDFAKLENGVDKAFKEEQADYLQRLFLDGDDRFKAIIKSFSIDKQKLFNANMEGLRKRYLDNSRERLIGEQDFIKRKMLKRIMDYVEGRTETLDLHSLTKYAYDVGDHLARLFARDQMQRFNKALTITSYESAGATKVKWITSHDARVRPSHKALDGQIFDINNLPDEVDDYNCRCGLVPVEFAD